MHAAIVDDIQRDAKQLERYFVRYGEEAGVPMELDLFSNGVDFLEQYQPVYDLVVLDIDMPGLSGVDTARRLRKRGDSVVLMFVTNMPQYALAGYEVEAVDYVLKPVAYQDFALKLRKAQRYIQRNRDIQIALRTSDGAVAVAVSEILYVESSLHYLTYHLLDREIRVRASMGQAEELLPPQQFARCNSGYLVNLRHVEAIGKEDVTVGSQKLKVSRGKRLEFMERFTRYLGGMEP